MKRKVIYLALITVGLLLPGVLTLYLLSRPTPAVIITPERVGQIQPGMTKAEVNAIFGGPSGDYSQDDDAGIQLTYLTMVAEADNQNIIAWITEHNAATATFDAQDRVKTVHYYDLPGRPWYARLMKWFGFQ